MFEHAFNSVAPGVKCKKNPIYEIHDIRIIKLEDLPDGIRLEDIHEGMSPEDYAKLVEPDYVGKLAIPYQKDNIGRSGGNAIWCYVFDCNDGVPKYRGTAIHKAVDLDYQDQNYNEAVYSAFGRVMFNPENIRVPSIDLVKSVDYKTSSPAVLSYNIVHRGESNVGQYIEEMRMMKIVALNKMERQDIHDDRITLPDILESINIEILKKVKYEKDKAKDRIAYHVMNSKLRSYNGKEGIIQAERRESLLTAISKRIDSITPETSSKEFLMELSEELGREITVEEIGNITINGVSVLDTLRNIRKTAKKKQQNYQDIEKSIIQVTIADLFTQNSDRHLNNWALIRDKKTDRYSLGLFDHATTFNMSLKNDVVGFSQSELRENWAITSVLVEDGKRKSSNGIDLFRYIMEHHREYAVEILQQLHDKMPEIEQAIGYETIPNAEYNKLSSEEQEQYYKSGTEPIAVKKIMENFRQKFKKIRKEYKISFDPEREYDD